MKAEPIRTKARDVLGCTINDKKAQKKAPLFPQGHLHRKEMIYEKEN